MKHLSKALVALSLVAAGSAVHAQTSYYGTTFDGGTGYPYTDQTAYASGFADLNGQGNPAWTATPGYAVTNADGTTTPAGTTGIAASLYSGNGTAVASHGLSQPTVSGFAFNTDFQISDNADTTGAAHMGNDFEFNFINAAGLTVFSVNFAPTALNPTTGAEGAPDFEIVQTGVTLGIGASTVTSPNGPALDQRYHLNVQVGATGGIMAILSGPGGSTSLTTTAVGSGEGITSFSVSEADSTGNTSVPTLGGGNIGGVNDRVDFDNISVVVPEPSTYAMMGLGLLGTIGMLKFRRRKA